MATDPIAHLTSLAEKPLIVIVGPTASGKSSVAIELAEQLGGEIICADSRTIYTGTDIGTAKPSHEDQAKVPHWGLDLVKPGEPFSAADFKDYAVQKIAEIRARGNTPFLVGGTGLYIDGVIFDFTFGPPADLKKRAEYEKMSLSELHNYCIQNNILIPENDQNKRYVIRAIEQKDISTKRRDTPINNCIIVGIATDRATLRKRINTRSEQLFASGVIDETKALAEQYGWDNQAMTGNMYRLIHDYVLGTATIDELYRRNEMADWHLSKRQLTWFKRNSFIQWMPLEKVKNYIVAHLA
jgi:tRNA dimethylallyltransferase